MKTIRNIIFAICGGITFALFATVITSTICFSQSLTQQALNTTPSLLEIVHYNAEKTEVTFTGGWHDEWLKVQRHNHPSAEERGFDPSYVVVTSDFKPIVTQRGDKWEIQFTSSLTEHLP